MITRNNYEEFFLLYVDNELSDGEKITVERFVEENPDLQQEWEATLQCKLTPDNTDSPRFGDLDLLRKTETIDQDQLLLYLDRELAPEAATKVGAALHTDKALQQEFSTLQKTISKPDTTIIFPDKSTLYRKEERRVVYLPWFRLAAAAAVVGVIVMVIFKYGHNNHSNDPQDQIAKKSPVRTVTPATPQPLHNTEEAKQQEQVVIHSQNPIPVSRAPKPAQRPTSNEPQQIAQVEEFKTTEPEAATQKLPTATHAETVAQATIDVKADKPLPTAATVTAVTAVTASSNPANSGASFATQALLADNIEDQEGDGDESSRKKHKLRGFFRKVSRVLEKSANRDDDDKHSVLIGGFQFALK